MAKFYGEIGYAETKETAPGVWIDDITKRMYSVNIIKNTRRWQDGDGLNDDLVINNTLSIVADPYANQHFHNMKYVEWMGTKWKVRSVEVNRPRLILTIGGIYNE